MSKFINGRRRIMSIPHVKREVLSEFVQPTNDTKVSVQKKGQLWEVLFQDESVGLFETEEAAQLKAGMVLSEY
jgi:hypothetical protein